MPSPESKQYEIRTIKELVEAARESGDTETLAQDLGIWLQMQLDVPGMLPGANMPDDVFHWIDDGDPGISKVNLTITLKRENETDAKS